VSGAVFQRDVERLRRVLGIAPEPQPQAVGSADRPILGLLEGPLGLRVERRSRVIVCQRHRLLAAVDDGPLGERRVEVADRRSGVVDPAVKPGVEDRRAGVDVVVVALEIVDARVLLDGETPEIAFPQADGLGLVDLVHPPVVARSEGQIARRQAGGLGRADWCENCRIGAQMDLV